MASNQVVAIRMDDLKRNFAISHRKNASFVHILDEIHSTAVHKKKTTIYFYQLAAQKVGKIVQKRSRDQISFLSLYPSSVPSRLHVIYFINIFIHVRVLLKI